MDLRRAQSIAAGVKCSRAKKVKELRNRREVRRLTCTHNDGEWGGGGNRRRVLVGEWASRGL